MHWHGASQSEIAEQAGVQLRAIRKQRKLSQAELASLTGLNRMTISKIERGHSLTFDSLVRLLRAFGLLNRMEALLETPDQSPMEKLLNDGTQG